MNSKFEYKFFTWIGNTFYFVPGRQYGNYKVLFLMVNWSFAFMGPVPQQTSL